jgi:hypothetical protein
MGKKRSPSTDPFMKSVQRRLNMPLNDAEERMTEDHGGKQGPHVGISKLQQISSLTSISVDPPATSQPPLAFMAIRREK